MILTGDIGGTKVNLALFDIKKGIPSLSVERSYVSRDYSDLIHLLEHFLKETQPKLTRACLGVAGPVYEGKCQVTHLPWEIDIHELKSLLGIDSVSLINDLAALAYAVPHLTPEELEVIQEGRAIPTGISAYWRLGPVWDRPFSFRKGKGATGLWKPRVDNAISPPAMHWKSVSGNFSASSPLGFVLRMFYPDRV